MRRSVRTLAPGNRGPGQNPILHGYAGLKREMHKFFAQAPPYAKGVVAKRNKDFKDALEREKQSGSQLRYDNKNEGTSSSFSSVATERKVPHNVGFRSTAKRVTQDSPMPPSGSFKAKMENEVINLT